MKNKIIANPDTENDLGNTIEDKEKQAMDDSIEDVSDVAIFSGNNRSALGTTKLTVLVVVIVLTVLVVVIIILTLSMLTRVREMIDGN